GLVEIINDLIGQELGEKVSAGHVIKAMILNGLGMVSQPLYMFPKFFENIACEHLIGPGVKAEYLNDDKIGRVMDKLFIKGLDGIFLTISLAVVKKFEISLKTSHLDSSSFHVHGEYTYSLPEVIFQNFGNFDSNEESEIKSLKAIEITHGYSRDHRPDLKQFIMELICSGDGDIPIFLKTASGNQVDSKCFGEIATEYSEQIKMDSLMVADCALYTESNIKLMSNTIKWLSRVPLTLTQAKELVSSLSESEFTQSKIDGYSYVEKSVSYAGVKQRWLVVQSNQRRKSDLQKLSQNLEKSRKNAEVQLKTLSQERFACSADAMKALSKITKKFKYHQVENIDIAEKEPSKKNQNQDKNYQISATVSQNENAIDIENRSAGRFIIATNVLEVKELNHDEMIREYKAQQSCERGFGFLKDPLFFADSIFLKSPERIQALAMIMGLCLLVYTLAQRQLRAALSACNSTVKNQLGKSINNPTLRWIFQCFQSIHLVTYNQETDVSNLTPDRHFILSFLPENCRIYYNYVT
ncbi:IS1634 family transposase, partial [Nostoc sp. CHAB 5836]|uniref:IS1634 family transposase n=1 Tax=Nostoc sp. CHAB 5836 TaxID=2780404 RepID=UPI001E4F4DEA